MKKILPLIVILAVLALGGWFVLTKNQKAPGPAQPGQPTQGIVQTTSAPQSFTGKIKDALGLETPMKCEWKTDEQHFGTTWIKEKRMYNEVSAAGKMAYTIIKDNCLWSWGEASSQGVKMCLEPKEGNIMEGKGQTQQAPPSDIDYHCRPDVLSDAKFDPPTDINFMDVSQLKGIGQ